MVKGKDIRITVILECSSCNKKSVSKESRGISRYITQKNRHNTPSRLELRILSLLLQTYDSRRDKEIEKMDCLCVTLRR